MTEGTGLQFRVGDPKGDLGKWGDFSATVMTQWVIGTVCEEEAWEGRQAGKSMPGAWDLNL